MEALFKSTLNFTGRTFSKVLLLGFILTGFTTPATAAPDEWSALLSNSKISSWNLFYTASDEESVSDLSAPVFALSCIPHINISLDQQGIAVITGVMLVNAPDYPADQYVVDIMGPLTNTVSCVNIGQELMAVVTELPTGNSCMSTLHVEDKLPPVFHCEADFLPCNTDIPSIDFESLLEPVTDNCDNNPTVWYSFVSQNLPCNPDNYTKQILVTWTATDDYGNSSTCVDTIFLIKPSLGQIVFPPDISISCVDADTDPSNTGEPTYAGEPIDHACQFVSFKNDVEIPMCNGAYKIKRTWTVMDWCTGSQRTDVQEILIIDNNKPEIACPPNITLSTDFLVCTTKYTLPMPVVSDLCADDDQITIEIRVTGIPGIFPPGHMVNLGLGTTLITMKAIDPCGNSRMCQYSVTIEDDLPPVIACPGNVTIECEGNTDPGATGYPIVDDICDNDPEVSYEDSTISTDGCALGYIITRTWTAEDESGNQATCMQMIILTDDTPPVIICPTDITISCEDSTLPENTGMASATDMCDSSPDLTYSDITIEGTCPHEYIINRTWVATDDCDNSSSCLQVIFVDDDVPPVVVCPEDLTIECTGAPFPTDLATATDNCSTDITITYTDVFCVNPVVGFNGPYDLSLWSTIIPVEGGSVTIMGDNEVMLTSSNLMSCDDASVLFRIDITNTGQIVFDWHFETNDVGGPAFDPFGYNLNGTFYQLTDDDGNDIQSGTATVAVTSGDVFALEQQSTDCILGEGATAVVEFFACINDMDEECTALIIRTHIAIDECNNQSSCVQTIFFEDTTSPTITCPADVVIECTESSLPANTGTASATDDCDMMPDISYTDITTESQTCVQEYTITRTWTAADGCGNTSTCVQIITVDDSTPPIISCPANVTLECDEDTSPSNAGLATATDNCDTSPLTDYSDVTVGGACPQEYTITRTWVATDACGNVSSCNQIIVIDDSTAPLISCPSNLTIQCDESTEPGNTGSATASDNCDNAPIITYADLVEGGVCPQESTITRTWTATDACGNSTACIQLITVDDSTPPTIACPADITIECDENTAPVITGFASATDNCDTSPLVTFSDVTTAGGCPQEYTITRTWTATDACGNGTNCIQVISVEDNTPPIITCAPSVTIECDESTDPSNTGSPIIIFDCDPNATVMVVSDSIVPGTCPQEYEIWREWLATDACGNLSECLQLIVVEDSTPPTITFCPANTTIECDESTAPGNTGFASATDNCATAPVITFGDVSVAGGCPQEYTITRTWIASDGCGNSTTCVQIITVDDSTPPLISCPSDVTIECTDSTDPADIGEATASDNCDNSPVVDFEDDIAPGDCTGESVITRTWTATDACGNSSTCIQTIFVEDTTPPTITFCAANITIECDESTDPATTGITTATDNCDDTPVVGFADVTLGGACPQEYTITRTWTATDACGNGTNCIQIITVDDSTAPEITCPVNITVECDESNDPSNTGFATAEDNCDNEPVVGFSDISVAGACPQEYTITRTWTATDACGNSSTCAQQITVDDSTPPVITCPVNMTIECDEDTSPLNTGFATATDNCTTAPLVEFEDVTLGGGCPQEYTINRTWTATDMCGNSSTCVQTITVDDSTPPTISCPSDVTIECTDSTDPADIGEATASDNCDNSPIVDFEDDITPGVCTSESVITRTWTATDACGNSLTCVQVIDLKDTTPPTITFCAADVTIECDESTDPATTGITTATDNCDDTPVVGFTDVTLGGACPQEYTITRTWTATDACGNGTNCIQIITVDDSTPPVITCPVNITVECDESTDPSNTGSAVAVDNCDSAPIVGFSDTSVAGGCPQEYTITRTWTATDACGNSSTCVQQITVDDSTPPVITCPTNMTIECDEDTSPINTGFATATDNCTTAPSVEFEDVTLGGGCPQEYTINRTWTATDMCGNSSTCVQTITVDDSTPPVISCPSDITIACTDSTDPADTGEATASDNCDNSPVVDFEDDIAPGDCTSESVISRTWTATDACGNTSTCIQTISIIDEVAPVITCPADITIACTDSTDPLNTGTATASDNCDDNPAITFNDVTVGGDCPVLLTITRTWTATDACGNSSTCVQIIVETDEDTPLITCPADITIECDDSTDPANTGMATATDLCSSPDIAFEDQFEPGGCAQESTIFRTWTATDGCGHASTCLQIIQIIDSTAPVITCPANVTVQCNDSTEPADTGEATAIDNCDDIPVVQYSDITSGSGCPDGFIITRTWTATDRCGNSSTCIQTVTVDDNEAPLVSCPADITIQCIDSTSPDNTGQATATDICDAFPDITFTDLTIAGSCPQVYTITRTWIATDNCGNTGTCNQSISVVDDIAPICFSKDITVSLDADGTLMIFGSDVDNGSSDACGPVTLSVSPDFFDCNTLGDNDVVLTVTDCSGNTSVCDAIVTVVDESMLMANCQNVTIFIDENGMAFVDPEDINNGSGGGCDPGPLTFELDQTMFNCTELGNNLVILTVTDEDGNTATCTANVNVVDNLPPVITCPPNLTVDCHTITDPNDTDQFGDATATDNCPPAIITETHIVALNNCGVGTITRTFVATDGSFNTASCVQVVTVTNPNPLSEDDITWPDEEVEVDICDDTDPEEILNGVPVIDPVALLCADPEISYEDEVEMTVDNDPNTPCKTITRTWTIVDDCQQNGTFEFVQTIFVADDVPPLFTNINDMTKVANNNCVAAFTIIASATDCGGVTITNDSPYGVNNGANASGNYPYGVTVVIFTATDGCGNISTMDVVITVTEVMTTEMICEKQLIFLPFETEITLNADTFVTYSVGTCSSPDDFIISYSGTNPFDTLRTYDCGDVGVTTFSLWMWTLDGSMLVDSCNTADLDLRDPLDYCQDGFTMEGTLESETGLTIPDVEVSIMNAPMIPDTTNQAGHYMIVGLNEGVGYGVTPFEDRDHRKGVSTLDLVKIQKHLLGKELLDSPYKIIAADANNSGSVTAIDLLEIRKVILGINSKFPDNTSWRFVDKRFSFVDPFNPFTPPFPEYIWVDSVTHNIDTADFVGLKVGDVNGSFFKTRAGGELIEPRSASSYEVSIVQETEDETGDKTWVVYANPDQDEIIGMQFSFYAGELNQRDLNSVSSEILSRDQWHYHPNTGMIYVSWSNYSGQNLGGKAILSIPEYGHSLDIRIVEMPDLVPEAYVDQGEDIDIRKITVSMGGLNTVAASDYHLYQNVPNPFSDITSIKYALPADELVTLVIHDVTGRQVLSKKLEGRAGINEFLIKKDDIGIAGIYYYTLYTLNASFTHKMSFTND